MESMWPVENAIDKKTAELNKTQHGGLLSKLHDISFLLNVSLRTGVMVDLGGMAETTFYNIEKNLYKCSRQTTSKNHVLTLLAYGALSSGCLGCETSQGYQRARKLSCLYFQLNVQILLKRRHGCKKAVVDILYVMIGMAISGLLGTNQVAPSTMHFRVYLLANCSKE